MKSKTFLLSVILSRYFNRKYLKGYICRKDIISYVKSYYASSDVVVSESSIDRYIYRFMAAGYINRSATKGKYLVPKRFGIITPRMLITEVNNKLNEAKVC